MENYPPFQHLNESLSQLNIKPFYLSLLLFTHMLGHQTPPNAHTFPSLFKAASASPFLASFTRAPLHAQALKRGMLTDPFVQTALLGLYAKLGNNDGLSNARKVFEEIPVPCIVSCNAMLDAFGRNGDMGSALVLFEIMIEKDVVSWTSIINGFARGKQFKEAIRQYGTVPTMEHYGCMVDLLGRAGLLTEASEFIKTMPFQPDSSVLVALLGACKIHGAIELGNEVGRGLLEQPRHCGLYVALSSINADMEKWYRAAHLSYCLLVLVLPFS